MKRVTIFLIFVVLAGAPLGGSFAQDAADQTLALKRDFVLPLRLTGRDIELLLASSRMPAGAQDGIIESFFTMVRSAIALNETHNDQLLQEDDHDELVRLEADYERARVKLGEDFLAELRTVLPQSDRWQLDQLQNRLQHRAIAERMYDFVGELNAHPLDVAASLSELPPNEFAAVASALVVATESLAESMTAISQHFEIIDEAVQMNDGTEEAAQKQMRAMQEAFPKLAASLQTARGHAQSLAHSVQTALPLDLQESYARAWLKAQYPSVYRLRQPELIAALALADPERDGEARDELRSLETEFEARFDDAREVARNTKDDSVEQAILIMKEGLPPSNAGPYHDALLSIDRIAAEYQEKLESVLTSRVYREYQVELETIDG